jgi:hypothetical protein
LETSFPFFQIFDVAKLANDPQEDLMKIGYRPDVKVENLKKSLKYSNILRSKIEKIFFVSKVLFFLENILQNFQGKKNSKENFIMIEKTFNCGAILLNHFPIVLAFFYNFFANCKFIFLG